MLFIKKVKLRLSLKTLTYLSTIGLHKFKKAL